MEKRYQVFVSSTYTDLKEERQRVTQTLMEMDCIPAGMELFPATDEEQWEFIKRVINDCDYYLLIIGGRYGSTTSEGISFTEKEYDYAVELGIKVIALIHGDPDSLDDEKCDKDPELIEQLNRFKKKVSNDRLVKFWEKSEDLPGMVALSLQKTIKMFPAIGWVRNDGPSQETLLQELNELRKENSSLQKELEELSGSLKVDVSSLADLEDTVEVSGKISSGTGYNFSTTTWKIELRWIDIFSDISPFLSQNPNQDIVRKQIAKSMLDRLNKSGDYPKINEQDFQTIIVQFKALGLINIKYSKTVSGGMGWFWSLTPKGEQLMYQTRAIKKN